MHTQNLCSFNFSFLMFQSLKSPVLLTFLKCYSTVITVFVMRDFPNGVICYQSSEALGKKKGLWLTCSNPLHTWSDNSDQTGKFFIKIFHSRRKKFSPVVRHRKESQWLFVPEFILGCAAQYIPAHEGGKCALHKCAWGKSYGLWGSFSELCLYYGWAKVQVLCFFFP